ncbi:MAG: hypothetical protein ABW039_10660 [Sphingobium sp.]
MRKTPFLLLSAALALSACGKKPEEPVTNNLVEPPVENVIIDEPDAAPPVANNSVAPAPAPEIPDEQQIQDDAAAAGMTSRLPANGEASPVADEATNSGQ